MAAKKNPDGELATLSTRFTGEEIVLLRKAADRRQWSLSQLIRSGALEKARHIENSTGDVEGSIRSLLANIVRQLEQPSIKIQGFDPEEFGDLQEFPPERLSKIGIRDIFVERLTESDEFLFLLAIEKLGADLAPILRQEWKRAKTDQTYCSKLMDRFALSALPTELTVQRSDSRSKQDVSGDSAEGPSARRKEERSEKKIGSKKPRRNQSK